MAQTIKIKRSTTTATPSTLSAGELAYSEDSRKLFIGRPNDGAVIDIAGELYTDMLDHTAGTLTASSAIVVDSNSKIDQLLVDNITLDGNAVTTSSGNLQLNPTANLDIDAGTIDLSTQATEFKLIDNSSTAVTFATADHTYITLDSTNSSEKVTFGRTVNLAGNELILDADGDTSITADTDDRIDFKFSNNDNLFITASTVAPSNDGGIDLGTSTNAFGQAFIDNLHIDGNDISSTDTDGNITLTPNGDGQVVLDGFAFPTNGSGSDGQFLRQNSAGDLEFATVVSTLTLSADSGTDDTINTGETLTFTGGEGIDTTVSDNTITIAAEDSSASNKGVVIVAPGEGIDVSYSSGTATVSGEDATSSNKGIASFDSTDFTVTSGNVVANAITLGSSSLNLGETTTAIAGLTTLTVDNIRINGNEISSENTNGDISLNPNGTGEIDANNAVIKNLATPTSANHAATKGYVDGVKQALDIKDSVRVATTANITIASDLNVGDTIDGVTLADGDRVLVKDQSTASENGIYVAGSSPVRSADANTSAEVTSGMFCFVEEGTVNGDNGFVITTNDPITLDTTNLTFVQFSGAGQIIAGDALSKSGNTLNVNDDNITLEVNSDNLRIKGITATAIGDLLIGAATNGGYSRLVKPSSDDALLTMGTAGTASWTTTLDGGTF